MSQAMSNTATLSSLLPKLPAKDQPFALSLLQSIARYGSATAKQNYWVDTLIERATNPQVKPAATSVGNFSKVYALFAVAKKSLKYPKIRLQVSDTLPVALAISGSNSARPNVINVTDGGPFGSNKWYGRVEVDGTWTPGRSLPELPQVAELLQRLGDDPAGTAAEYGRLTGYCCFCARQLTDEQSTAAGYGKVCAQKYELTAEYKAAKPVFTALIAEAA